MIEVDKCSLKTCDLVSVKSSWSCSENFTILAMITARSLFLTRKCYRVNLNRLLCSRNDGIGDDDNKQVTKCGKEEKNGLVESKKETKPFKPQEDWLPAERPWEQGLPDHMKPQYPQIVYPDYDVHHPKVSDEFSREGMHPMQARYKYPQFDPVPLPLGQIYESFKEDKRFHSEGRVWRTDDEVIPSQCDVIIIGGGIIGTAIAYMMKQRAPDSFNVLVLEKDMTVSGKISQRK